VIRAISVLEIAKRLGYSDTANFSHAFVRWSGMPPSQYRKWFPHHVPVP
jgi:AraC-like DNA-binding protein